MASSASTRPVLPDRLGIAADLVFSGIDPAVYLLNSLLMYEQVVIPLNPMTLGRLTVDFSGEQLKRLAKAGRILFCPEMTAHLALRRAPAPFSRAGLLAALDEAVRRDDDRAAGLIDVIDAHLICGNYGNFASWRHLHDRAEDEFHHVAGREGYEGLMPPGENRRYYLTGLKTGLARLNDLIVAGVPDMQLDVELPVLMEICFPAKPRVQTVSFEAAEAAALQTVQSLHGIKGLPLLNPWDATFDGNVDRVIDVVLSDEAASLRAWFRKHWQHGLDVRDAYIGSEQILPSKKAWTGWLKFGAVTGVSTAIGALITDPIIGAVVGTGLGALDQQFGQKSVEKLADNYHPAAWLAYVGSFTPARDAG